MKWVAFIITAAVGLGLAFLAWREAQKPYGDNPPWHFAALFLCLALLTLVVWTVDRYRKRRD